MGRESSGDGVSVVVVGVTPHRGRRESCPQGEGTQADGQLKGERVRDARIPEPSGCPSTGELIDAETVTISSERGGWKSACQGNSLAAYSTLTSGFEGGGGKKGRSRFPARAYELRHKPIPRQPPTLH